MSRSTSKTDSAILRAIARRGRSYVSLSEDRSWLQQLTPNPALQLTRMAKRGSLAQVARGRYVVLPDGASNVEQAAAPALLLAAAFAGLDYYLGYLSALVEHRLTDEASDAVYLAVKGSTGRKLVSLAGKPVRMTRIVSEEKWFGIERVRAQGSAFYCRSDLERTLLDTLDRPRLCGRTETWVRCWERAFAQERVDVAKLVDYAGGVGGAVAARCGFWLRELGRVRDARLLLRAIGAPLTGRISLDASAPFGAGPWSRDRETGLIANMPEAAITGWLEYGK
jgi:predicted transcriptional regulator of viral defense system